jgi:CheY-like chemotaxis protein/signal transduction histidine kinase
MLAPLIKRLTTEPYQSGIIAGSAALGAAAVINIASHYLLGSASAPGVSGFLLAAAVSAVAGTVSVLRAKKRFVTAEKEFELASRLAAGDFSACMRGGEQVQSPMAALLAAVAERQLNTDTANARLVSDASLREEQLFSALDCVDDEIAVYDRNGLLVATNRAFSRRCNEIGALVEPGMLQSEVLEALARSQGTKLAMNERESWFKRQAEMRSDSLASGAPVKFIRFGGDNGTLQVHKTVDGNTVEIVRNNSRDIELEERALRAEREAAAADRIKAVTLSRLSHTIRTPMTGVLTAAELMLDSDMDALQRSRLDIIRRSAGTLLGVVQDMFDLAEQSYNSTRGHDAVKAPRRAILFASDGHEVAQAKSGLTDEGFEVAIAESAVLVAEAVWQLASTDRPVEMIVVSSEERGAEIVRALSGRSIANQPAIKVRPIAQVGQENFVDVAAVAADIETNANEMPLQRPRLSSGDCDILVVEDDDVNQIAFSQALSITSHRFSVVGSGAEAVAMAKSSRPKLVLMDVSMPDMNGIEATRRIREQAGNEASQPTIIGMTNHFLSGDRNKCLAAGMDEYVLKPSTAEAVTGHLDGWLNIPHVRKAG